MTRYAIRLVEHDSRPEQRDLFAQTRRTTVRGLGPVTTYRLDTVEGFEVVEYQPKEA